MNKALILYQPFDGLLNLIKYITDISYKAQWNDMQLRDCGDIAGLKRIEYIFEEILSSESAIKPAKML